MGATGRRGFSWLLVLLPALATCGAATRPGDGAVDAGPCDADGDGHESLACGGDDCDDSDPRVNPSVEEDESPWRKEVVAAEDWSWPSLAVDGSDGVHILFSTADGLTYARRDDGGWTVEDVGEQASGGPDVAVSSVGDVHAVWATNDLVAGRGALRHGFDADGDGVLEVDGLEFDGFVGGAVVALDSANRPHVVYRRLDRRVIPPRYELRHAIEPGVGSDEAIPVDAIFPFSMSIDDAGALHVAGSAGVGDCEAMFPEQAVYMESTGGIWTRELIESDENVEGGSLALGRGGVPRVALHFSLGASCIIPGSGLRYGARDASGWLLDVYEEESMIEQVMMASDETGTVHLAFVDSPDGLFYQADADGVWAPEPVDDEVTGPNATTEFPLSIDVGPAFVHLVYGRRDGESRPLMYARRPIPDGVDNDCDGVVW